MSANDAQRSSDEVEQLRQEIDSLKRKVAQLEAQQKKREQVPEEERKEVALKIMNQANTKLKCGILNVMIASSKWPFLSELPDRSQRSRINHLLFVFTIIYVAKCTLHYLM